MMAEPYFHSINRGVRESVELFGVDCLEMFRLESSAGLDKVF
jgi:hypothetical protein